MKITFAESAKADIIAFLVDEDGDLPEAAAALNETTGGLLSEAMDGSRFSGKKDQQAFIVLPKGSDARRAVLIGAGKKDKRDARVLEGLGANLYKSHSSSGFKSLAVHAGSAEDAARIALGAKLASYRFDTYFTKLKDDQKPSLESVTLVVSDVPAAEAAFVPLNAGAEGTKLARDLVNMPPNDLYPASFAEKCRELGQYGVQVEVLGEAELAKLGMNSMLGVGQGSVKESQLGVMKWMGGAEGEDPVILIGKGVCFDTGGISLKPGPGMEDMKWDMGGAGAVAGAMLALVGRKAKANVVGVVGLVENMPDGKAQRPGDVVTSMSGQTIEVLNTDAEGRLVLADALHWTQEEFQPARIIDFATLTGAMIIALGNEFAGVFSNDDKLAEDLHDAGEITGDRNWRMPIDRAYDKLINSPIADMKNIGPRYAGSITAAQFIKRFVDEGVKWAHLDIAGMVWSDKPGATWDKGATGYGVRLLDRFVTDRFER